MKVCKLKFKKNDDDSSLGILESYPASASNDEMKKRMNVPLKRLVLKRFAARKSKNYDRTVLSREIAGVD